MKLLIVHIQILKRSDEIMATNIPLTGTIRVTCEYGRKGNWAAGWHTGIDMVCDDDTIYGTCDGTVYKIGVDKSYGNYITVKAPDGKYHWFCHLSKVTCKVVDKISRTTKIGVMGNTGNSTQSPSTAMWTEA